MPVSLYTLTVLSTVLIGCLQVNGYSLAASECRSPSDCGPGECCVLGNDMKNVMKTIHSSSQKDLEQDELYKSMMRYSMAQCMPLGQVEDYCRDDNPPENRTLYYPNGEPVEVTEIYTHVCPCDDGLQCVDNFCAMDDSYENNYLY